MRIFLAEWRKLRRPTFLLGSIGSAVFVTGLVTSVIFLLVNSPGGNGERGRRITKEMLQMSDGLSIGFRGSNSLLGLIALATFASMMSQEYSLGTLRNLLVRQPRRIRLLLGKYFAMLSFALCLVLISAVTGITGAYLLAGRVDVSTIAWSTNDARTFGYGTIGMILGLFLRSPMASISTGTGFLLVVESILSLAWKPSAQWLPGNLLTIVASGGKNASLDIALNYSQALTRISIYLLVAALLAVGVFKRRDVAN
jgi:ABC-2 type transport system permease protein